MSSYHVSVAHPAPGKNSMLQTIRYRQMAKELAQRASEHIPGGVDVIVANIDGAWRLYRFVDGQLVDQVPVLIYGAAAAA